MNEATHLSDTGGETLGARALPRLHLAPRASIFDVRAEDVAFDGYDPWPTIKAAVAV